MTARKPATTRRSTQRKADGSSKPQSSVDRSSAEAEVRALVARFAPAHERLIAAARRSLRRRLRGAHEIVYEYRSWFVISFSPSTHGYEGVLAIRADASGVKLYFNRGTELPDPEGLLRGSGRRVRSIDLAGASTLARPAIASLVKEAVARSPVPFGPPATGRGSVLVRLTSAKGNRPLRASRSQ